MDVHSQAPEQKAYEQQTMEFNNGGPGNWLSAFKKQHAWVKFVWHKIYRRIQLMEGPKKVDKPNASNANRFKLWVIHFM